MTNPSFVGSSIGANGNVSRTPASGNDLILQVIALGGTGVVLNSVSDSAAGTTVITDFAFTYDSTHGCGMGVYRVHAAPNTTNTFSVSWTTAPTNYYLILSEASGVFGLDIIAGSIALAAGNSTNPTTGSLSPLAGDLLLAAFGINHFVNSLSWAGGFTQTQHFIAGPTYATAYLPNAPGGSTNAGISIGATAYNYGGLLVAYSGSNSGFYPLSHSMQTQGMQVIYPSSSAASWSAANYAYWDGTTGIYPPQRVGVAFGRWPFLYELISGPPGMYIGATTWNAAWNGNPAAAFAAGYGTVYWTPNGSNTTGTNWNNGVYTPGVTVRVYDQNYQNGAPAGSWVDVTWPLSVVGSSSTQFCFINADDTGADSTGTGKISAPWQTIGKAAGINGASASGAAGSICILRGATAQYWLPPTVSGGSDFAPSASTGPASYIGMPGETAVIDLTGQVSGSVPIASTTQAITPSSSDLFFGNLTLSGYPGYNGLGPSVGEFRAFTFAFENRMTFQNITWNNAGFGTTALNNASMIYTTGGAPAMGTYLFITGCQENNRQSDGLFANNTPICLLYNYNYALIELNTANSPNSNVGHCMSIKSDISNGCVRSNLINVLGGTAEFGALQAPYQSFNDTEFCYNVGINVGELSNPDTPVFTYGTVAGYRNNIIGHVGLACKQSSYNLIAPYTSTAKPFGYSIPAISASTVAGNALANGTWYYCLTTLGVTGETTIANGNGGSEMSLTTSGSQNTATVPWNAVTGASRYRVYRGNSGSGSENQYIEVPPGTTSLVDTGNLSWTAGTPPSINTAVSSARFIFNSMLVQTPTQISDPTGATIERDRKDVFEASGMLDTATGLLTSAYKMANPGVYGVVGAEIG